MCGRYVRKSDKQKIAEHFAVHGPSVPDFGPSWNVAPQTFQPIVRLNRDTSERELVLMRWGLVPYWAKDRSIGLRTINAKAETIADVVKQRAYPLLEAARAGGLPKILEQEDPKFSMIPSALAVRMLFSALIDADLLDTEQWDRGHTRAERGEPLKILRDRLVAACERKTAKARDLALTYAQLQLCDRRLQCPDSQQQ